MTPTHLNLTGPTSTSPNQLWLQRDDHALMGKGFAHKANIEFESEIEALDQSIAPAQHIEREQGDEEIIYTDKLIL